MSLYQHINIHNRMKFVMLSQSLHSYFSQNILSYIMTWNFLFTVFLPQIYLSFLPIGFLDIKCDLIDQ